MPELDEMVKEFLVESIENLEQLDRDLILLEEEPGNLDIVNRIFRTVHTVKGTCSFFDFSKLESVSHVGENLLDSLRSGALPVTPQAITGLLSLSDTLREILSSIEHTAEEGIGDYSEVISILEKLNSVDTVTAEVEVAVSKEREAANAKKESDCDVEASESEDELEKLFWEQKAEYDARQQVGDLDKSVEPTAERKNSDLADSRLRVDVAILDKLMNLVGELVLARNQILQFTKTQSDGEFLRTSQRLNLITSELQEGVMRTRMQPISTIWNKLPRVVRDIALSCGKEISLEMFGKETELDKTIIEAIKDPLTHIIRNSVDHGIESQEQRVKAGKPAQGTLSLKAFHEGGQVVIEISDDGGGLNLEKIKSKALEKGLVTAESLAKMKEADIHNLIFSPGFSTAEKVTNISGRGVGMDVVRSNIERIGGVVDVASEAGRGSTFTIKIPLTLAIIPGLVVTSSGCRYAIPQVNLLELVRIEGEQIEKSVEKIGGADFYRLRGRILPLIHLNDQLEVSGGSSNVDRERKIFNIVVVRADNHQFGLVVDEIHDTEEIVVKPLGRMLQSISTFAGATIMGDGKIALIIDVVGISRKAQLSKKEAEAVRQASCESEEQAKENLQSLFVFELGKNRRAAVPLENVYRLEEFPKESLEQTGENLVIQYRDGILPLVDLRAHFEAGVDVDSDEVKAFVYATEGKFVGFIIDRIVDIVSESLKLESPYETPGVLGSGIVQGKVTDVLDLAAILERGNLKAGRGNSTQEVM